MSDEGTPEGEVVTAALSVDAPVGGWTTADLDELPEDGRRRELIDGVLIVTPSPSTTHQTVAVRRPDRALTLALAGR
jgi:hypothetical protein